MTGGGLMQLVAYGAQDVYLTGNPQITFFKAVYRRHTNFAMEAIEQTFSGQADFGRRVTCTISRNGDLAYRTYLQVTLPEINQSMGASGTGPVYARWLDYPGEQLIAQVEVEIGGQRIDRQYGDWMHIWNQLTLSKEQERGYHKMIGHTTQLTYLTDPDFADVDGPCAGAGIQNQTCTPRNALPESTLYIPLLFWFCRNPGLALPLVALQYHEVKINLEMTDVKYLCWDNVTGTATNNAIKTRVASTGLVSASLYVDYIYLDTDERRKFAQVSHEYLIEQVQHTGTDTVDAGSTKQVRLSYNHPVKELVWCFSNTQTNNGMWNFTTASTDANIKLDSNQNSLEGSNCFVTTATAGTPMVKVGAIGGSSIFTEEAVGPLATFKLILNGQDRFKEQKGKYFNQVQSYNHHTGSPYPGIYSYSFALKPEEHQPTGTCNFSRIDNAQVQVVTAGTTNNAISMHMFATNYNVLRIQSGMGGLAFSN